MSQMKRQPSAAEIYDQMGRAASGLIAAAREHGAEDALRRWDEGRPRRPAEAPTKRFHRSDALVYEYTEVDVTSLGEQWPTLHRHCVQLAASPGRSWRQVSDEVNAHRGSLDRSGDNPPLFSVMTETEGFYVALTYKGFVGVVQRMMDAGHNAGMTYDEHIDRLAKELVASRDHLAYRAAALEAHSREAAEADPGENACADPVYAKRFMDFWPAD